MIIKLNLASRPTRNYTLYFLGCIFLIVTAVAFTVYNVTSLVSSLEKSTALGEKIAEQEKLRTEAQTQSSSLRNRIAAIKTPDFVSETEFLNNAIKRRVFSWTTLFDQFEAIFPNNVRMTSVTPTIQDEEINIRMEVTGKDLNDIIQLIKVLQAQPAFSNVVFKSEKREKEGGLSASISLLYRPELAAQSVTPPVPDQEAAAKTGEKQL